MDVVSASMQYAAIIFPSIALLTVVAFADGIVDFLFRIARNTRSRYR